MQDCGHLTFLTLDRDLDLRKSPQPTQLLSRTHGSRPLMAATSRLCNVPEPGGGGSFCRGEQDLGKEAASPWDRKGSKRKVDDKSAQEMVIWDGEVAACVTR